MLWARIAASEPALGYAAGARPLRLKKPLHSEAVTAGVPCEYSATPSLA
jgi:hypothetical protein